MMIIHVFCCFFWGYNQKGENKKESAGKNKKDGYRVIRNYRKNVTFQTMYCVRSGLEEKTTLADNSRIYQEQIMAKKRNQSYLLKKKENSISIVDDFAVFN